MGHFSAINPHLPGQLSAIINSLSTMLPLPMLTAVAVSTIDLRHHLATLEVEPQPVGIALFTANFANGVITFNLETCVLEPTEPSSRLLEWLDVHVPDDRATIVGFDVEAGIIPMLRPLSESHTSFGINVLGGLRGRKLIDLPGPTGGSRRARSAAMCATLQIPVDTRDVNERFSDWMFNRQDRCVHAICVDAIATWRVAMALMGTHSKFGAAVTKVAEDQLQHWLAATDASAALIHRDQSDC